MDHAIVDSLLCRHDGSCVESCPIGVLELASEGRGPVAIAQRVDRCVRCGHCVTVCPTGALELASLPRTSLVPVRPEHRLEPEQAEQLLRARRSIRCYRDRPVPRDLIERVLQSACYAPSGHNRQPVVWTVVSGADSVRALSAAVITWMQKLVDQAHPLAEMLLAERLVDRWHRGEDPILRHAPQVVIAHTAAADPTGSGASLIAMTYFQLAAEALELATCWAGYFQMAAGADPAVAALVKLPADHRIHAASMLGYAKYSYPAIPPRNAPNIYWQ